ncbi:MAG: preprotein translocase subunit SecA, partial [Candidatus Yonathbacteria bacterium CG_4_10_14_3_um_filter_47_65]
AYLRKEGVAHEILNAKNHEREGEIIAQAGKKGRVTIATNMAGRGVDIKLGGNPSTQEEYEEVKNLGGLFVVGTERHEARRIDNQLRGRSGRQGDPGETQFFVSFEDDLMRVFATDTIKKMMGKFGIPEDEPVENRMITKSLESAQTKIEGFHFDARKHVLEYDDVMNRQRKSVYGMRRKILLGGREDIREFLVSELGDDDSDANIQKKVEAMGEDAFYTTARVVILQTIDMLWMEHLEAMDYMRSSVNLRAYGQRDPLVEYKNEGTRMFKEMQNALRHNVGLVLENIEQTAQKSGGEEARTDVRTSETGVHAPPQTVHGSKKMKVGRNDPCPCGSGKKYKKCHGA